MQWDAALGLDFDAAREYDPATGRFQQEDPKGFAAGDPDLFRYAMNGPTDGTDPSGFSENNVQQLYSQSFQYYRGLEQIDRWRNETSYTGDKLYVTNDHYKALVDAYTDFFNEFHVIPGVIEKGKDGGDLRNKPAEFRQFLAGLSDVPSPTNHPMNQIGGPLDKLSNEITAVIARAKRSPNDKINEFAGGALKAAVDNVTGIVDIYKAPRAVWELVTNGAAREALLHALEERLEEVAAGDPAALGELIVELPLTLSGVGAGVTAAKAGAKLAIRVTGATLKAVGKTALGKLKGKDLIKFLYKAEWEAAADARQAARSGRPAAEPKRVELPVLQTGPSCFVAGTPLLTPTGSQLIESFVPGDLVWSRDQHDPEGAISPKAVEAVFVRFTKVLGVCAGGRSVGTTAEHPFWVQGKGWVPAWKLSAGDRLVGHDGQTVGVERIVDTDQWSTVYNLRIADLHTYFVGCDEWGFSVWAHNAEYSVQAIRNSSGSVEAFEVYNSQGKFVRRYRTQAEADSAAATWNKAPDPLAAPGKAEGAYPPLDPRKYKPSKDSAVFSNKTPDGKYVYVLDEAGVIHIAPEGSHMHPKILGGGQRVNGAGGFEVKNGQIVDIDNMSGTFRPHPDTLGAVEQAITAQGGKISPSVKRSTLKPEDW
jgi:RHS repeat-associated protein